MNKFELCRCGAKSQWVYMPGYGSGCSPYSCDDCVNRGCSCNTHSTKETYRDLPDETEIEGVDWEWLKVGDDSVGFLIENEKEYWRSIDEKGRPYPCCEYEYSEIGFYTEEYQNYLEEECKRIGYDIMTNEVLRAQHCFIERGEYFWFDDLIEDVEKIIKQYNDKDYHNISKEYLENILGYQISDFKVEPVVVGGEEVGLSVYIKPVIPVEFIDMEIKVDGNELEDVKIMSGYKISEYKIESGITNNSKYFDYKDAIGVEDVDLNNVEK